MKTTLKSEFVIPAQAGMTNSVVKFVVNYGCINSYNGTLYQ